MTCSPSCRGRAGRRRRAGDRGRGAASVRSGARAALIRAALLRARGRAITCSSHACTTSSRTAGRSGVLAGRSTRSTTAFAKPGRPRPCPSSLRPVRGPCRLAAGSGSRGEVLARQLAYWKHRSGGSSRPAGCSTCRPIGPRDRTGPRAGSAALPSSSMPQATGELAGASARREGVTLFMTLLAAFRRAALPAPPGQEDVAVGSPIAGRTRSEAEGSHRLLRQHAGAAREALGADPVAPRAAGAGAGGGAGRVRPPGHALLRAPGARARSRPDLSRSHAVPGDVRAPECAQGRVCD